LAQLVREYLLVFGDNDALERRRQKRQQPPGTWNLTTAMADDAIDYMKRMNALTPDQPFFVYYGPGGTHAPHHPTKEWVDKISAMHRLGSRGRGRPRRARMCGSGAAWQRSGNTWRQG
jgi:arylsulfatase A-like enzyme